MSKELIEQLRDLANCRHDDLSIGYEAADSIEQLETERDQLRNELEIERMRNVACGVVAMADTPDSAKQARDMHPDYMSAACSDVARRVDECIKLREQVKMLRDALEVTHELYANASSGYGFARPENPHNFHCDIDCCSKEEIEAHSKACDDYAAGRKVSNDSWGIGTYCDEYAPAIKALAATEPRL